MDGLLTPVLLFLTGLLAGTINVLAGGGSMLTLPVMIFLGLPPTVANGTNRVAILVQNVGAVGGFQRHRKIPRAWLVWTAPSALVGAVLGTWAAVNVGELAFQRILAVVLMVMVVVTLWTGRREIDGEVEAKPPLTPGRRTGLIVGFFFIGVYGGFIQAGIGFVTLALLSVYGLDLVRANALKATVVLIWTVMALTIFAWQGKVDWFMGGTLALGNLTGALIGVRMAVLKGQGWIRKVVTAMVVVFAVRLLWGA